MNQRDHPRPPAPSSPGGPGSPYLTTAEAAEYLRYQSTAGIRCAVRRGELVPAGAGPRGCHLFHREDLDTFARKRAQARGRKIRKRKRDGHEATQGHQETRPEEVSGSHPGHRPENRQAQGDPADQPRNRRGSSQPAKPATRSDPPAKPDSATDPYGLFALMAET